MKNKKSVMYFKKPIIRSVIAIAAVCAVVIVYFLTKRTISDKRMIQASYSSAYASAFANNVELEKNNAEVIRNDETVEVIFPVSDNDGQIRVINIIKDGKIYSQSTVVEERTDINDKPLLSYKSVVTYANWSEDSRIFTDALNSETMNSGDIRHLPVFRFDTKSELERFKLRFSDVFSMDHGYAEVPSFNDATSGYDDNFFSDYSLILCYITANSGSFRYDLRDISIEDSVFCMNIIQTNNPEIYTCDMAGWFAMAEIADSDIANCTDYDARFVGISECAIVE